MTELDIPTVTTRRLILRGTEQGDFEAYTAMDADPAFTRFIGGPKTNPALAWRGMALQIGTWALRGLGLWTAVERATGEVVGRTGLWWEPGWPGIEAVWFIIPSRWGRGYAPEAARAALRFAFENHDADRVVSVIRPDNIQSIRVAEKIGESFDHTEHLHGADKSVYAITRDSWTATQGRLAT